MLSFDTNIAVHAANATSSLHHRAYEFIASLGARSDVAVCELMLVELYLKLRNGCDDTFGMTGAESISIHERERIFTKPEGEAASVAQFPDVIQTAAACAAVIAVSSMPGWRWR